MNGKLNVEVIYNTLFNVFYLLSTKGKIQLPARMSFLYSEVFKTLSTVLAKAL